MNSSRNLLLLFLAAVSVGLSSSRTVTLDFPSFSLRNLTLLGDSYLRGGVIGLTSELSVPSSSSGSAVYNLPISFFDPDSNATASFSTRFSFSIDNINPSSSGDGLTFFLSPNKHTLGTSGSFLGLVNSSTPTKNRFIALEFDTRLDSLFHDPDDNHLGLDLDSLTSVSTANLISRAINLKSGNPITAWIDYSNDLKKLDAFLSYSSFKPDEPVLTVDIDLSDYLKDLMFLGFTASTEGSTERHSIHNWDFHTIWPPKIHPRTHPHNVSDTSVPPLLPSSASAAVHRPNTKLKLALAICFPFLFIILICFCYFAFSKWKMTKKEHTLTAEAMAGPRQFTYREVKLATKGFHQSRIIGHGAFGTVYKAFFMEIGTIAAVKRSKHSHEGKNEFLSELSIIAGLRHKNLVQLQGWCSEKNELLLVYEFMPNGSLDNVLYQDTENGNPLKWEFRYNIAVGLASVLTYLHQECEQQVIHRDIKSSNIMLDGCHNARLGDFGLARLMDHDKSPVSTLTAGTMGYLAPEYLQCGKATEKTDVFSFGVVILELACGRRPIEREGEGQKMVNLVDWVWAMYSEGRISSAADGRLKGRFDEVQMKKLLLVGLSCANPDFVERPSMRRVLQILNSEVDPIEVPRMKPSLSFSNTLPLSIDEILCDDEDELKIRVG